MSYINYKKYYELFSKPRGYYKACDLLAFQSNWLEFSKYKDLINKSIKNAKRNNTRIIGADVCCGEYAWLLRHFYKDFRSLYCVDLNPVVFKNNNLFKKRNVIVLVLDVAKKLPLQRESLDFLYCGYNVYMNFLKNFVALLKNGGQMFLMKPKEGDDFILRARLKNYNIMTRKKEINNLSCFLQNKGVLKYKEFLFNWSFEKPNLDKILAALSVVSLGQKELLSNKQYDVAMKFLEKKIDKNHKLILSQICSIWQFKKEKI